MRRLPVETREVRRINAGSLDFMTMNKYLIKPLQRVKALQDDFKNAISLLGKRGKPLSNEIKSVAQQIFNLTNSLIAAMQEYSPGRAASVKKILARGRFLSMDIEMQQILQKANAWVQETGAVLAEVARYRQYMPPERYERIKTSLGDLYANFKTFKTTLTHSAESEGA